MEGIHPLTLVSSPKCAPKRERERDEWGDVMGELKMLPPLPLCAQYYSYMLHIPHLARRQRPAATRAQGGPGRGQGGQPGGQPGRHIGLHRARGQDTPQERHHGELSQCLLIKVSLSLVVSPD